jgi:hypothetical protein
MESPDPDQRGTGFGVPRVFVRWWPLWIILVILTVVLLGLIPALIGARQAVGSVPQSTGTSVAPGS